MRQDGKEDRFGRDTGVGMTTPSPHLSIGRLAIKGFSRAAARRVEDAFRAELGRAAMGGLMPLPAGAERIVARLPERRSASPEQIGAEAARALIRGLRP